MSPPSWFEASPRGVIVSIKAVPRSSKSGIDGLYGTEAIKVRIKSAPVDGKANKELIETLAEEFKIPKACVEFLSGTSSKHKRILLHGISAATLQAHVP